MSTKYPAGTAAMITAYNRQHPYRAFFDGSTWREYDADYFCVDVPTSIRPLVVLDLERVGHAYDTPVVIARKLIETGCVVAVDIANEITEQTRPPRPAEPTGVGAVVEDAEGLRWVRVYPDGGPAKWRLSDYSETDRDPTAVWSAIDAVKVLSEGVCDV